MFTGNLRKIGLALPIFLILSVCALDMDAYARAGFGRSFGSRGSRSLFSPSRPYSSPFSQTTPSAPPTRSMTNPAMPQQPRPSFMRSLAGGLAGGFLGSMLFSSLGHAMGWGGGLGGSGIGLMDILLIGGLLYGVYWFLKRKPLQAGAYYEAETGQSSDRQSYDNQRSYQGNAEYEHDANLRRILQTDPGFDEPSFKDQCMDSLFKIQAAWINRDMSSVRAILTTEMFNMMEADTNKLKSDGKINKLDNIAVRSVDVTEAWREDGVDFITVKFLANLLDYTVSETTGELLAGNKTEPVKFVEYWTFTRPAGTAAWQLSAINQAE